jgi:predicted ester cyclase
MHGTHSGEYLRLPPAGQVRQHEFYRVADGLITEERICSDTASLLQQIR